MISIVQGFRSQASQALVFLAVLLSLSNLLTLLPSYDSKPSCRLGIWQCPHKPPDSPLLLLSFIPLPTRFFMYTLHLLFVHRCLSSSLLFAFPSPPSFVCSLLCSLPTLLRLCLPFPFVFGSTSSPSLPSSPPSYILSRILPPVYRPKFYCPPVIPSIQISTIYLRRNSSQTPSNLPIILFKIQDVSLPTDPQPSSQSS